MVDSEMVEKLPIVGHVANYQIGLFADLNGAEGLAAPKSGGRVYGQGG
jgi:hypothetical protein